MDRGLLHLRSHCFSLRILESRSNGQRITKALAPREGSRVSPMKRPNPFEQEISPEPMAPEIPSRSPSRSPSWNPSRESSVDLYDPTRDEEEFISIHDDEEWTEQDSQYASNIIERPIIVLAEYIEPPRAVMRRIPSMKERDAEGNKIEYTSIDNLQQLLSQWIEAHYSTVPREEDIDRFRSFMIKCLDESKSPDSAIETTQDMMRWWRIRLRQNWPQDKVETGDGGDKEYQRIGTAWWSAFASVRISLDSVVRARFGGRLAIR
ncbi:hypothetical protein DL96DRAFT_1703237 [Flagelloscypha sp. PMI_526]|nr:hypothetical protein DL96DRAFT_1703237 [Flagelloscypha sp. PMI_526]